MVVAGGLVDDLSAGVFADHVRFAVVVEGRLRRRVSLMSKVRFMKLRISLVVVFAVLLAMVAPSVFGLIEVKNTVAGAFKSSSDVLVGKITAAAADRNIFV